MSVTPASVSALSAPMPIEDLIKWLHTEQEVFLLNHGTKQLVINALLLYKEQAQS